MVGANRVDGCEGLRLDLSELHTASKHQCFAVSHCIILIHIVDRCFGCHWMHPSLGAYPAPSNVMFDLYWSTLAAPSVRELKRWSVEHYGLSLGREHWVPNKLLDIP